MDAAGRCTASDYGARKPHPCDLGQLYMPALSPALAVVTRAALMCLLRCSPGSAAHRAQIAEPERVITFRVSWLDDAGNLQVRGAACSALLAGWMDGQLGRACWPRRQPRASHLPSLAAMHHRTTAFVVPCKCVSPSAFVFVCCSDYGRSTAASACSTPLPSAPTRAACASTPLVSAH